jgi:uncharacterized protein
MERLSLSLLVLFGTSAFGQHVLHYAETSGFDHNTRDVSLAMFADIAAAHGASVTSDIDGTTFSSLPTLQLFDVVVFCNTSGDAILDSTQRANFEMYMATGGNVMGIHAASDTYRHSTANGSNTGTWDFYAELIGASVQQDPNHVNGTPLYELSHIGTHPSTEGLPDPWPKEEEYYYWENGYYRDDNIPVLEVEETVGPNLQVNSYDAPRPMSWFRQLPSSSRVFYTALGHSPSNYTSDPLFIQHIENALVWALHLVSDIGEGPQHLPTIHPNPAHDQLVIELPMNGTSGILMIDATGRMVMDVPFTTRLDVSALPEGLYTIMAADHSWRTRFVIVR